MSGCTRDCNQGRSCTCGEQCQSAAPEGGNYYPEPTKLNVFESIALYLILTALSLISFGLLAAGAGSLFLHFYN